MAPETLILCDGDPIKREDEGNMEEEVGYDEQPGREAAIFRNMGLKPPRKVQYQFERGAVPLRRRDEERVAVVNPRDDGADPRRQVAGDVAGEASKQPFSTSTRRNRSLTMVDRADRALSRESRWSCCSTWRSWTRRTCARPSTLTRGLSFEMILHDLGDSICASPVGSIVCLGGGSDANDSCWTRDLNYSVKQQDFETASAPH